MAVLSCSMPYTSFSFTSLKLKASRASSLHCPPTNCMMAVGWYGPPQFGMRVFLWGAFPTENLLPGGQSFKYCICQELFWLLYILGLLCSLAALPIGFAVFMVHLATFPITGTGINPAGSFGAAVIYNKEKSVGVLAVVV